MPASDVSTNILIPNSRILYVDPNDIYGKVNGVSMTPDYSDFCISFDLECEIVARYKTNEIFGQSADGKYNIGFTRKVGVKGRWASLLQGEAYQDKQVLTTYYTDINYDTMTKETVVEGLGVESLDISFESYYSPSITIKFVDHRGAALFGREEAIHYNDKLTIDNIFGAFFTIPYPKFRLQVKGFYGKAVTYQLTCTGFKGSLNSQTGNFEAIVNFIGYSYALLTDIPFEYLVAAPYCKYVGEDYWKAHKKTDAWRLENSTYEDETPTLFQLLQRINAAFNNGDMLKALKPEDAEFMDRAENEIICLDDIADYYIRFLNSIDDVVLAPNAKIRNYEPGNPVEDAQILFMSKETDFGEWTRPKACWEDLMKTVEVYNEGFKDNKITENILPTKPFFENISFTPFFVHDSKRNGFVFKDNTISTSNLAGKKINDIIVTETLAGSIVDFMNKAHSQSNILPNVYLLNCGSLEYVIEKRAAELKTKIAEINRRAERNYLYLAMDNLGMVPYIGNIFKIILCHIETLLNMMSQCYENIMLAETMGQRTASYLGINRMSAEYNGLDVWSPLANIPPWPSVNRKDAGDNEYSEVEKNNTLGWVGDFSDYFEEAKLVRALYAACKHISVDPAKVDDEETVEFLYAPILPNDLNNDRNPFDRGEKNLSALGGMLGIRIAQIFGIGEHDKIDDEIAKTFGQVDALNYYRFIGDKVELREIVSQSENLTEDLYNIMLCKDSADKYCSIVDERGAQIHDFEFTTKLFPNKIPIRQPIFAEISGNRLNYTYMANKNYYGIIPSNTRYRNEYLPLSGSGYIATTEDNTRHYINVDYPTDKTFLHYCSTKQLFSDYNIPEKAKEYTNTEMYRIVTGAQHVGKILERYDQMKGGVVKVVDGSYKIDLKKLLDRYWTVEKKDCYKYLNNTGSFFCKPYSECGIEDRMLLGSNFDTSTDIRDTLAKLRQLSSPNGFGTKFIGDKLVYKDGSEVDPNNAVINEINCVITGIIHSLFGVDFYYMQNQIADEDVRNRTKAFLFLHSLYYNKNVTLKWETTQDKKSCINRIPFGLAALYGAFLWRHDFIRNNDGRDPIQYGDGSTNVYKPALVGNKEYSFYTLFGNNVWEMNPRLMAEENYTYAVFGEGKTTNAVFVNQPDPMVANELKGVFQKFLNKQWRTISQLELRRSNGNIFTNGADFRSFVEELSAKMDVASTYTVNTEESENTDVPIETLKARANALNDASKQFASFSNNYAFLAYNVTNSKGKTINNRVDLWLNPSNTTMQDALRSTYLDDCIELRSMCWSLAENADSTVRDYTDVVANIDNAKSYLNGFAAQVKEIIDNPNNDVGVTGVDLGVIEDTPEFNRDVALPIYMYLKMLWDKWLVSLDLNDNEFSVANFEKNFVFIDSFYRNIASRFMINCQLLLDCYNSNMSSNLDISVFKFMGDLTTKHNCMFVTVPDFITNWADSDHRKAAESLVSIFKPIPYSAVPPPEENNKFVIIYIPKLSESPSELNNFRDDGFNIWSYNENNKNSLTVDTRMEALPEVFRSINIENIETEGYLTRYGYYVPSFGLAYGRQNNAIFKDIKLSMDAPTITSAVINTLSHTSRMGANNTHKVAFIGQDIYPVFSNYSYICEFEMMGCAQIQPLMYFQLMNVPMWRGTYIIYSVSHSMRPGNMVTRVKAMKLSNRAVPYSNAWFTENPNFDKNELRKRECLELIARKGLTLNAVGNNVATQDDNQTPPTDNGQYGTPGIFTGKTAAEKFALCGVKPGMTPAQAMATGNIVEYKMENQRSMMYNKNIIADLEAIQKEINALGWFEFKISNCFRDYLSAKGRSRHQIGCAVDINAGAVSGTNPWFNCKLATSPSKGIPQKRVGEKREWKDGDGAPWTKDPRWKNVKGWLPGSIKFKKERCIWDVDHPVVKIFAAHGWGWGGSYGDVMHFSLDGQ